MAPLCLSIVVTVICLVACTGLPQLSVEQKLADFDYLFATLRDNHPFLFLKARVEGYDWIAHETEFREAVRQTKNNREFETTIRRVISLVGNAHTQIVNGAYVKACSTFGGPWADAARQTTSEAADYWVGLRPQREQGSMVLYAVYSGGRYYVCKSGIAGIPAGSSIAAIDGTPIDQYIVSLRGTTYLAWDPIEPKLHTNRLSIYSGKQRSVTAELVSGEKRTYDVQGQKLTGLTYFSMTPYSGVVYSRTLAEGKVGYVHVRSMSDNPDIKETLNRYFASVKDLPALIIDVRENGGGSDRVWMEYIVGQLASEPVVGTVGVAYRSGDLVQSYVRASCGGRDPDWVSAEELTSRDSRAAANLPPELFSNEYRGVVVVNKQVDPQPNSVRYQGKVFLLVDEYVYSSTESFAAFAKASGWATVVGNCTGGDGIGSTPALMVLPCSKMAIAFPTTMGLNPDWTANEETHTIPDVVVEQDQEDLMEWLRLIEVGRVHTEPDLTIDTVLRECVKLALEGR